MTGENSCKVVRTGAARIKDGQSDVLIGVYKLETVSHVDGSTIITAIYSGLSPGDVMKLVDGWVYEEEPVARKV